MFAEYLAKNENNFEAINYEIVCLSNEERSFCGNLSPRDIEPHVSQWS